MAEVMIGRNDCEVQQKRNTENRTVIADLFQHWRDFQLLRTGEVVKQRVENKILNVREHKA